MLGDEVEEGLGGVLAALFGHLGERAALQSLVGAGEDLALVEVAMEGLGQKQAVPLLLEPLAVGRIFEEALSIERVVEVQQGGDGGAAFVVVG